MDDSFQNSYPVENKTPEEIGPPEKSGRNLTVLNIGQILALVILFIIICLQTVNILFEAVQNIAAEPMPDDTGIVRQQPEAHDISESPGGTAGEAIQAEEPEIIFILGENNGRLAVLSPDGQTVHEIFNIYISTLPEYDRNLLIEGIKIKTTGELASLLEDFTS